MGLGWALTLDGKGTRLIHGRGKKDAQAPPFRVFGWDKDEGLTCTELFTPTQIVQVPHDHTYLNDIA